MKKDFLAVSDFSAAELQALLDSAVRLKRERAEKGANEPLLKGKMLAMIFQKPSLRTRVSLRHGHAPAGRRRVLSLAGEIGLGQARIVADVARVLSGYVDALMARIFEHQHVLDLAKWAGVPVINGLTDYNHPCQAMADGLTILEKFGRLKGLQGRLHRRRQQRGHLAAAPVRQVRRPLHHRLPRGLRPQARSGLELARGIRAESGTQIKLLRDPHEAVNDADVIYTDTWTSMGQEEETEKRLKVFPPYQVNAELVSEADKDVIVMHCLPAHRGQEITDEVADGPHSVLFPQAENRMHAQKAMVLVC